MARDLGKRSKAMILRNHGVLALGETVREAFEIMYYLDCACQIQVDACAGGMHNVHLMPEPAARTASEQFNRSDRAAASMPAPATRSWREVRAATKPPASMPAALPSM